MILDNLFFEEVLRKERLYVDLGGKGPPPNIEVPKKDIKEYAQDYKGTPIYDKFVDPGGFMYGNTRIVPK